MFLHLQLISKFSYFYSGSISCSSSNFLLYFGMSFRHKYSSEYPIILLLKLVLRILIFQEHIKIHGRIISLFLMLTAKIKNNVNVSN